MDNRFKYHRSFLIFTQEDSRNGEGGGPSGYLKIEIKDGKGRLSCQLSNLKESNEAVYKLYLINGDESNFKAVCSGAIPLRKGKGELDWKFNPGNIGGAGLDIADINIAAIILENNNEPYIDNILCPLAAYKNGKIEWRQKLRRFLNKQRAEEKQEAVEVEKEEEIQKTEEIQRTQEIQETEGTQKAGEMQTTEKIQSMEDISIKINPVKIDENEKIDENITSKYGSVIESIYKKSDESSVKDKIEDKAGSIENGNKKDNGVYHEDEQKRKNGAKDEIKNKVQNENENKAEIEDENRAKRDVGDKISFEELVAKFDRCFEKCNPFVAGRKDYRWWKIASPVHLNNILYQMKIDVPILFNPLVLMAHFKYRHLLVGVYEDKTRNLRYIVCGVPGVYWVDEKPFGKMCRWAQVNGNIPKYGAFGYWLVYINPTTGEILNMS